MRDRNSESLAERAWRRTSRAEQAAQSGRNPTSGRRQYGMTGSLSYRRV